ncbi:protein transport protein SEC23 [Canna indica]|uniref:Protein transport protein SEC23 n=1 Tax=Canna indica TaxID=4628 RepID=A0AAQ3QCM5_9LILI|nr:protein transport protein SEC23 [Canna indica]
MGSPRSSYSVKRRLRVRTLQLSTARNINDLYDSVHPDVVLSILVHKSAEGLWRAIEGESGEKAVRIWPCMRKSRIQEEFRPCVIASSRHLVFGLLRLRAASQGSLGVQAAASGEHLWRRQSVESKEGEKKAIGYAICNYARCKGRESERKKRGERGIRMGDGIRL